MGRAVQYPRYYSSFTPSFAPTHDSSAASNGFGYYQTWEAAMGKASVHSWMTSGWNGAYGAEFEPSEDTSLVEEYRPRASGDDIQELLESLVEDTTMEIDPALVDAVDQTQREMRELQKRLDQNAVWVRQLQQYQEIRVRRGQREPLEEEDRIGECGGWLRLTCADAFVQLDVCRRAWWTWRARRHPPRYSRKPCETPRNPSRSSWPAR